MLSAAASKLVNFLMRIRLARLEITFVLFIITRKHVQVSPRHDSRIFIGGISQDTTEQDLKNYFESFGVISSYVILYDKHTSRRLA